MHPILAPGIHVLRRDAATLQLGLDPAHRVLLPDTPRNRRLLLEPPSGPTSASLTPALLADDAPLRSALPASDTSDPEVLWRRHSLASAARDGRPLSHEGVIVLVTSYGGALGERLAADLRSLLARAGLPAPTQRRPGPRMPDAPAEVHVVVGVGEPSRALLSGPLAHTTHLLLRFVEGRAVVGPFVVPGRSSCLHCVDLHRTDADPAWPLLVEQYTRVTRQDRPDGVPEPVDAALAAVACGWVAREVSAHLAGDTPVTSSRTLTMTADLVEVATQAWPRRPDCGCASR